MCLLLIVKLQDGMSAYFINTIFLAIFFDKKMLYPRANSSFGNLI